MHYPIPLSATAATGYSRFEPRPRSRSCPSYCRSATTAASSLEPSNVSPLLARSNSLLLRLPSESAKLLDSSSDSDSPSGSPRQKKSSLQKESTFKKRKPGFSIAIACTDDLQQDFFRNKRIRSPSPTNRFTTAGPDTAAAAAPTPLPHQLTAPLLLLPSTLRRFENIMSMPRGPLDGMYRWTATAVMPSNAIDISHSGSAGLPVPNDWTLSPYRLRVLFLVPDQQEFTPLISNAYRDYETLFSERCDLFIQEITTDWHISESILRYNPSIIVSVGNHWMQYLLSGLCPERCVTSREFQDVARLHGNVLQTMIHGSVRYLFPLLGYTKLRRASCPGNTRRTARSWHGSTATAAGTTCPADHDNRRIDENYPTQRRIRRTGSREDTITTTAVRADEVLPEETILQDLSKLMHFISCQIESSDGSDIGSINTSYGSRRFGVFSSSNNASASSGVYEAMTHGRQQQQHYSLSLSTSPPQNHDNNRYPPVMEERNFSHGRPYPGALLNGSNSSSSSTGDHTSVPDLLRE